MELGDEVGKNILIKYNWQPRQTQLQILPQQTNVISHNASSNFLPVFFHRHYMVGVRCRSKAGFIEVDFPVLR